MNMLNNTDLQKQQKEWIWTAKGIAILLIVFVHFGPSNWWTTGFYRIALLFYFFHLPLFMFLSGYLFHKDKPISIKQYIDHIGKLALRIGLPFISVNLAYIILKLAGNFFFTYGKMEYADIWRTFVYPFAYAPSNLTWFLYVLFSFMLVYPLLITILRKKYLILLLSIVLYFLPGSLFLASDRFFSFFIFFCLGNTLRELPIESYFLKGEKWQRYRMKFILVLCTLVIIAIACNTRQTILDHTVLALVGALLGITIIVLFSFLYDKSNNPVIKILKYIGCRCMTIYLFHQPFAWFFPVVLHELGFSSTQILWGLGLSIGAGTFFPILLESFILSKFTLLRWMFLGGRKISTKSQCKLVDQKLVH